MFDLVSFFVLPARRHNHNTSSVSQVVEIMWLLRDVGGSDMPMRTYHCHLLLFLTEMVFASKMWLLRGAQRVLMFVGVSHMSRCARAIVQREEQHGMVHMSPKRALHSFSGEFVPGTTRRPKMCGARWIVSCVNPPCSLQLDRGQLFWHPCVRCLVHSEL